MWTWTRTGERSARAARASAATSRAHVLVRSAGTDEKNDHASTRD